MDKDYIASEPLVNEKATTIRPRQFYFLPLV